MSGGSRTGGLFKCLIRLPKNGAVGHTGMIIAMSGTLSISNFARHLLKRENGGYAYGSHSFQFRVKALTLMEKGSGLNEQ